MSDTKTEDPKTANKLSEEDRWHLRALNSDIDNLELQRQMVLMQSSEKQRQLAALSTELKAKYGLNDPKQVNLFTGEIARDAD